MTVDGATVASQVELVRRLHELADPDLVLDVRIVGVTPDTLELHFDEISRQLAMPVGSIGPNRARCLERLRRTPALAGLAEDHETRR